MVPSEAVRAPRGGRSPAGHHPQRVVHTGPGVTLGKAVRGNPSARVPARFHRTRHATGRSLHSRLCSIRVPRWFEDRPFEDQADGDHRSVGTGTARPHSGALGTVGHHCRCRRRDRGTVRPRGRVHGDPVKGACHDRDPVQTLPCRPVPHRGSTRIPGLFHLSQLRGGEPKFTLRAVDANRTPIESPSCVRSRATGFGPATLDGEESTRWRTSGGPVGRWPLQ